MTYLECHFARATHWSHCARAGDAHWRDVGRNRSPAPDPVGINAVATFITAMRLAWRVRYGHATFDRRL
jgi:hypothetical protein